MVSEFNYKKIVPLWIIGIFYILPLIINNSPYFDDIGRSVYGYFSWGIDGRPLSDLIFSLLDMGAPATNIAPFPQIACILILTSLCYLLHLKFNAEHKMGWLIFTPIFLSPFFVQNLAFQFDSLTMALSVAFACAPVFATGRGWLKLFLSSAAGVVVSLCFYQAALSAFIAVMSIYVLFELNKRANPLNLAFNVSAAVAGLAVGYVLYSKAVVPFFVTSDYANGYNQLIGGTDDLYANIRLTEKVLRSLFTGLTGKIFLIVFIFAFAGAVTLAVRMLKRQDSAKIKIVNIGLLALSLIVLLFCIPGPGLVLKNIPIGPRVFIGFGFFIAGILALSSFIFNERAHRLNFLSIIVCVLSFSFIATFANASKSQDKFTEKVINEISLDIFKVGFKNVKTITVDGKMLDTPVVQKAVDKYPLMRQLIPVYFDGPLGWGVVKMTEFYVGFSRPTPERQQELIKNMCSMQEISNGGVYKTYFKDGDLVISFSIGNCN